MENASKALVMAGSVLLALIILGALLLMFNNLSTYQQENYREQQTAEVAEFNAQFGTYNRTGVRGSDLYSLLNRAVDYNRRKAITGTAIRDEGETIGFKPIIVSFEIDHKVLSGPDGKSRLITKNSYTVSDTKNTFADEIKTEISRLENKYGSTNLTKLTTSLTTIFIDSPLDPNDPIGKEETRLALEAFNLISKKVHASSWNELKEGSIIREDIYTYYEYVQFKRANFDCIPKDEGTGVSGVKYDEKTGRIVEMYFKYNGTMQ